jgi:hypothetical protein
MNCQSLQNRILALPDPRQVPGNLRQHLDACPGCLAWWKQAAKLEGLLAHLPVPPAPADKKTALLDELSASEPVIRSVPVAPRSQPWRLPDVRVLAGLAAAVIIAVGGWLLVRPGPGTNLQAKESPRDPFLEKIVQRDLALAQARTADERLTVLGGLADDLSTEARSLSKIAKPDELRDLSGMFQKVVNEGIVEQARKLPEHSLTQTQKRELLAKLSGKLAEAGKQADEAARESPPQAQPALKSISETARDGQTKLKAILGV